MIRILDGAKHAVLVQGRYAGRKLDRGVPHRGYGHSVLSACDLGAFLASRGLWLDGYGRHRTQHCGCVWRFRNQ